jgi:hypothetical protein
MKLPMRAASAANTAVPNMARFFSLFFILQQLQVSFLLPSAILVGMSVL